MADYTGKFQYLSAGGSATQEGSCRVQFDQQTFTLTPDSGAPIVCDLGDIDAVIAADLEIRLPLFTGNTIVLRQFGKAYETLSHDLLEAFRKRTLQCLLLADMEELSRFDGTFELAVAGGTPRSGTAEFRLFKTNLAVLPTASQGFQWRLADVESVKFDPETYQVILQSGPDLLKAGKLAKRTEEFTGKIQEAMSALATHSAQALHATFPFLTPDQLQTAAGILREGHAAPVARLADISPRLPAALAANAVDQDLKPYYDELLARTAKDSLYAGFKLIRAEDSDAGSDSQGGDQDSEGVAATAKAASTGQGSAPDADADAPPTLYWFYFPMAGKDGPANAVAWEASSREGRATYFFRMLDPARAGELQDPARAAAAVDAALRRLDRVLGMLNFRRRPIYLSEDEMERDPKFHRYAIAARRIPELREVRAALLGRAIHSSFEAWKAQVEKILQNL
jgi:hypothetical protein